MKKRFSDFQIFRFSDFRSGLALVFVLLLASCDRSEIYSYSYKVDPQGWHMDDKLIFNIEVSDTLPTYTCYIDLRNRTDYIYSNIYLTVTTVYPQGEIAVDTNLEFQLAQPDGKWLGRDNGRIVSGRYPLCRFRFPEPGLYQFQIGHAMRDTLLKGINDVGMVVIEN